jgi:hypothetical protein
MLAERGLIPSRPAEIFLFPAILLISLVGCILGTLLTPPDDLETLKNFYRRVRPWGFWKPIHDLVAQEDPEIVANRDFKRDAFNVVVGIVWQVALTAAGIYIVLQDFRSLAVTIGIILGTSWILKRSWYDQLVDFPADLSPTRQSASSP